MASASQREEKADEEDENPIFVSRDVVHRRDTQSPICLVGRVWTRKSINSFGLFDTLKRLWSPNHGLISWEIQPNLFSFQFHNRRDADRILSMEPWYFNKHVIVLKKLAEHVQPSAMQFDTVPFWVRIYDLPLAGRTLETLRNIGNRLGNFIMTDTYTDVGLSRSVRIRIYVNLQPLRRGTRMIFRNAEAIWIPVKYERLPSFCHACGLLGHTVRDCNDHDAQNSEDQDELPYGEWLRASPLRPSRMVVDKGVESDLSTRKTMFDHKMQSAKYTPPISSAVHVTNNVLNDLLGNLTTIDMQGPSKTQDKITDCQDANPSHNYALQHNHNIDNLVNHSTQLNLTKNPKTSPAVVYTRQLAPDMLPITKATAQKLESDSYLTTRRVKILKKCQRGKVNIQSNQSGVGDKKRCLIDEDSDSDKSHKKAKLSEQMMVSSSTPTVEADRQPRRSP